MEAFITSGDCNINFEADMAGVEENVDNKADQMHEGRGRVRTSSQVFLKKEIAAKNLLNTDKIPKDGDSRRALAFS